MGSSAWPEAPGASVVGNRAYQIERLHNLYAFGNDVEVERYLEKYPFLVELLDEALSSIEEQFGASPFVSLGLVHDPEGPDYSQLVAYIHTSLSPQEAFEALSAFDAGWFLDQLGRTRGKLSFNIEFV